MEITLTDAIFHLYPGEEFVIVGGTIAGLEFVNSPDLAKPTQKQVDDAIKAIAAKRDKEAASATAAKNELLARLGITAEEAKILLG